MQLAQTMLSAPPTLESGDRTPLTLTNETHINISLSSVLGGLPKKGLLHPQALEAER